MTSTPDALSILKSDSDAVAAYFKQLLARYPQAPARLMESIEYSLLAGGKRLRPSLILETARACSASSLNPEPPTLNPNPSALAAAAAMELIHTFSLVHDDLPAMDDDDLRRGRPTNHKVYGEALAILAGDAMTTMAFEIIASDAAPSLVPALIRELAHNAGPQGMIGGQVLDIDSENKALALPELQQLHRMKTGALLTASCRLGAIAANADQSTLAAVTSYGQHLGLAFQIMDDILDVTSTPEQMGKATGKDAAAGKNTYPVLLGLDKSRAEAHRVLQAALDAVLPLGPRSTGLQTLARFVVTRQN